jgi:hypothetical protein
MSSAWSANDEGQLGSMKATLGEGLNKLRASPLLEELLYAGGHRAKLAYPK